MTSVVVVGSGVAGLTAARTLADNWPEERGALSVVVLEALGRIGGRTFTDRKVPGWGEVSGGEADIGASWIHGSCAEHPITRIKEALGLDGFATDDGRMDLRQAGGEEVREDNYEAYEALVKAAEERAADSDRDVSVWDAMDGLEDGGGRDNPLMQYHMANALEFNTGSSPHTLSAKHYNTDEQYEGDETLLARGYGQVPEALAAGSVTFGVGEDSVAPDVEAVGGEGRRPLDVRLNTRVTSIAAAGARIAVGTQGGESFAADHVVVAVPIGVLKKGTIKFKPALPANTATAIKRIGFGNVVKIGILFDHVFWDEEQHYFGLVLPEPGMEKAEKFTYFLNAAPAIGKPVLFTFAFGKSASEVETWSDEQVWTAVKSNLVAMFGKEDVVEARKVGMWRSRWGHEPDFGGAYSFAAVGSLPDDWKALGQAAMGGKLHFCGEHTSTDYRGTVHGAFYTGQRAAREILSGPEVESGDEASEADEPEVESGDDPEEED